MTCEIDHEASVKQDAWAEERRKMNKKKMREVYLFKNVVSKLRKKALKNLTAITNSYREVFEELQKFECELIDELRKCIRNSCIVRHLTSEYRNFPFKCTTCYEETNYVYTCSGCQLALCYDCVARIELSD